MDDAPEIDAEHPLPVAVCGGLEAAPQGDAGVVAEHVDLAEGLERALGERLHGLEIGDVGRYAERLAAPRLDRLDDRGEARWSMSARTTFARSRAKSSAIARPIPLAPPVTTATRPASSVTMRSSNRSFPLLSKVYCRAGSSIGPSAIASCSAPTGRAAPRPCPAPRPSRRGIRAHLAGQRDHRHARGRSGSTEMLRRGEARQYEIGPLRARRPRARGRHRTATHAGPREEPPQGLDEGVPACGVVVRNEDHRHAPSVLRVAEEPSRTMVGCLGIRGGFR